MNRILTALLDLIFPPRCVFCGRLLDTGEEELCNSCQKNLPWLTGAAAEQRSLWFDRCVSPLAYRDAVRDSLRRYKFQGRRWYCRIYGRLMAQCVQDHLAGQYDLITWAPLSAKRKRKRGYDQAYLLAAHMAAELGGQAVPTLRKVRHTAAQSGLNDDGARRKNVQDAYEILDPARIAGKRVLLVDDIVTTSSTLSACAQVLTQAGAAEVICVTAARARF